MHVYFIHIPTSWIRRPRWHSGIRSSLLAANAAVGVSPGTRKIPHRYAVRYYECTVDLRTGKANGYGTYASLTR